MRILIVDDERIARESLKHSIIKILGPDTPVITAQSGVQALEEAAAQAPDVAFLDIEMPGMSGLELAKALKERCPGTNIIFVTAHSSYALQAWRVHASDYLLKPADEGDIRTALETLRVPVRKQEETPGRLTVRCFGNFEVFCNGEIVNFDRKGAREMFAYLVTRRGSSASSGEISGILWEDAKDIKLMKTYVRQYYQSIRDAFRQIGTEDVLRHTRDAYAIDPEKIDCDYYRFLEMDPVAVNSYRGEFMVQYSWAEFMVPEMEKIGKN